MTITVSAAQLTVIDSAGRRFILPGSELRIGNFPAGHGMNTNSPKRAGTCGRGCACKGSDQMLMRRFGSTPSQRLRFAFQIVPGEGRGENSSKLIQGMATSRLQPSSL